MSNNLIKILIGTALYILSVVPSQAKINVFELTSSPSVYENSVARTKPAVYKRSIKKHRLYRPNDTQQAYSSNPGNGRAMGNNHRPRRWCGWFMRQRHGGGPEFNLAYNWRHRGSPAAPHVGAIVVWPHHVGEIVGRAPSGLWIVLSGNDGGRVRERARSIRGALIRDI